MEESSQAFTDPKKQSSESARNTKQHKITMNTNGRISRTVLEQNKRTIDDGKYGLTQKIEKTERVSVTYNIKYDSIGIYLSNQSAYNIEAALKSRLSIFYVGESSSTVVLTSLMQSQVMELLGSESVLKLQQGLKDLQFLAMCCHQRIFMKMQYPVFHLFY
jgi:G:T/U-mismatch repair DNA glycosylase